MISHYFVAFRAFMVGLFHLNSAAFSFLELLSGYQKCPNFPKIGTPLGAALPDPAAVPPQSTKQNYGPDFSIILK